MVVLGGSVHLGGAFAEVVVDEDEGFDQDYFIEGVSVDVPAHDGEHLVDVVPLHPGLDDEFPEVLVGQQLVTLMHQREEPAFRLGGDLLVLFEEGVEHAGLVAPGGEGAGGGQGGLSDQHSDGTLYFYALLFGPF